VRQAAQRHMELQGCMPADISTMGYNLTVGSQAAINKAFAAWQVRRGIAGWTNWKNRVRKPAAQAAPEEPKEKPVKAPRPPKPPKAPGTPAIKVPRELKAKLPPAEARERELARKRAYRLANKERANQMNRDYQRRRRAAMTPDERKAESIEVNNYRKKAKENK
jgi:hypothetical protein